TAWGLLRRFFIETKLDSFHMSLYFSVIFHWEFTMKQNLTRSIFMSTFLSLAAYAHGQEVDQTKPTGKDVEQTQEPCAVKLTPTDIYKLSPKGPNYPQY